MGDLHVGRGLLLVLCGPSGVGKSTIAHQLTELMEVSDTVSVTTREKREGDGKGKKYDHVSQEEFFKRLDRDAFLEYAQVHGEYYGTPKHPSTDILGSGKDVLLEIDVMGALQVRYQYPEALLVFILPPDEGTLHERLLKRDRESEEEITKRFRAAKREIYVAKGSRAFDYMVINDSLDRAVQEIVKIVRHKRAGGI